MTKENFVAALEDVMGHYAKEDYDIFKDTVDMLCAKGVSKGIYQDYSVLIDVLQILTICEKFIKGE